MSTNGWAFFKQKYLYDASSYKEQMERICKTAASHTPNPEYWSPKFFELFWNGWLSASTPVLANTGTNRGMSVSCSGGFVGDSIYDFYSHIKESALLTKQGFGTSGYLGDIRARGSKISVGGEASGAFPVFEDLWTMSQKVSQGGTRRGSWAGYLPISHGDFDEIADYVKELPDDANVGWCWYDSDTEKMLAGDAETIRRYQKMMKLKMVTGKGYIFKPDAVNRQNPQMYKDLGLTVKGSNLCSEITLFADLEHTFTCVLSSMNLRYYDDWKDTDAVFTATVFLDCIVEDFLVKARKVRGLENAVRFTEKGRALGLGTMGLHTYFQKNRIPFESFEAHMKNIEIFKHIHDESLKASQWMAKEWGEPEWCKGYGVRNTHRTAVAPTMSTADLMGSPSQGIDPYYGNVFVKGGAAGEQEVVNPEFLDLMREKGKYSRKAMKDIADHHGSVQHLDWLTDHEKLVFRTAFEINQEVVIRLAALRQKYICQAQSLNLFFSSDESEEFISKIHQMAIQDDRIKSLYYVRTQAGVAASSGECLSCQ